MSGHNKWSTIKRKKGAADAKRSKMFSRIVKEIMVAVKESGGDPDGNAQLKVAIQNAKGVNMPKDTITRAISKAESDDANYQEMTFEGYAPGGIAIFVEALSDNNNRTVASVRSVFTKRGGSLGTNGSLSFIFDRKGVFSVSKIGLDVEEFELETIDSGAEDFQELEEHVIITTALEDFGNMQKKLDEMAIEVENAELQRIPNNTTALSVEASKTVLRMIEAFEEDDDVQNVFHNLEMTDELEEALAGED
jgi:YebC/PmpR family DNA-binding regulatory protein